MWKKTFSYDAKRFSNCVQQKILIRVTMTDDKTRAKAMKTAAQFKGNNKTKQKPFKKLILVVHVESKELLPWFCRSLGCGNKGRSQEPD